MVDLSQDNYEKVSDIVNPYAEKNGFISVKGRFDDIIDLFIKT
jgi:hypothetical protein